MDSAQFHRPRPKRQREPYTHLRALGAGGLPERFCLHGVEYRFVRSFKHDFFAASGLYEGPSGRAVLKMGRTADFLGLPMQWLGRWLIAREVCFYEQLGEMDEVPRLVGRLGATGFVHEFVAGHNLQRGERVPDDFFDRLAGLLAAMHQRGIAYVDLEKCENIIVGQDGRPYLIDFQISWQWPWRWGRRGRLARWLFERFRSADQYHLAKHKRRCRPDLMDVEELLRSRRVGRSIQLHRVLSRPLTLLRRRILAHVERVRKAYSRAAGDSH